MLKDAEARGRYLRMWEDLIKEWKQYCEDFLDIPSQLVMSDESLEHIRDHLKEGKFLCDCGEPPTSSPTRKRDDMFEPKKFQRRVYDIEAAQVTNDKRHANDLADWCHGEVSTLNSDVWFVSVQSRDPISDPLGNRAFVGDWVVYDGSRFRVYTDEDFQEFFEQKGDKPSSKGLNGPTNVVMNITNPIVTPEESLRMARAFGANRLRRDYT